jgi:hypothetical protein
MKPSGLIPAIQSSWSIESDRYIVKPQWSSGIHSRFFKRRNNEDIYHIDAATDVDFLYQPRQMKFFTAGYTWQQVSISSCAVVDYQRKWIFSLE